MSYNIVNPLDLVAQHFETLDIAAGHIESVLLRKSQASCPVYHHFGPGIYAREVNLPAHSLCVGHRQRFAHFNIFLRGDISMLTKDGAVIRMTAPAILTAPAGRKVGFTHAPCVWMNVYATTETDLAKLEKTLFEESPIYKEAKAEYMRGLGSREEDRADYTAFLDETGLTEEQARDISECASDLVAFPPGTYAVTVDQSAIEGLGLYATGDIRTGDLIAPAWIGDKRTPAGRYTNHARDPNAIMREISGVIYLYAIKDIAGCAGGMLGDEITVNYRQVLAENRRVAKCQQ